MIELRDLRKEFAGTPALDGINLTIPDGQIHGIVGRSGAGKSTLIRCITGLETPTSGTVTIDGTNITGQSASGLRRARRSIGMVFQHANLLDSLTAQGNVEHPLKVAGVPATKRKARAQELLELVGLDDRANNHPAQLSGGQRQRVGIARALATEPSLLLCDEPTSALDSQTTSQILQLLRSLRDRLGITVLIITHEMSVVREICDAVTHLVDGTIAHTGTLESVLSEPASPLAKSLIPLPEGTDITGTLEVALPATSVTDAEAGAGTVSGVFEAASQAGVPISAVQAGTVEVIANRQVGRLRVSTQRPEDLPRLSQALQQAGYTVGGTTSANNAHNNGTEASDVAK